MRMRVGRPGTGWASPALWRRRRGRAHLAIAVVGLALLAVAGTAWSSAGLLALLPLLFVYVGLTQPPGSSLLLAPGALVVFVLAARFAPDDQPVAMLLVVVPASLLAGETIARAQRQRDLAHSQINQLLQAVRVLTRVSDERGGAEIVASLCARLLGADAVAVLVADRAGSGRLLNRAWFGHPALADAAPLVVDAVDVDGARGACRFYPDATATQLPGLRGTGRVRSAALLALRGDSRESVGLVVALWGTRRRRLPASGLLAAELVAEEAGRMIERLRTAAALTRDAQTDPLTQLSNRRTFAHALATLTAEDAIVIVDLDHFKSVNDRFGHHTGDEVLRALAGSLRRVARQVDCVARYGGEEFALVLPGAGAAGALQVLRRVRSAWAELDPITTFSAGVAVFDGVEQASETLRRADAALYEAKGAGRDRDVLAAPAEIVLQ